MTNSRGDIEELRHLNGSLIARYTYDTWGNTISIVDADGNEITSSTALPVQNPFRYRGYYYDSETGLYYLQSRYYDPVTCRFVNADGYVADGNGIIGYNMFVYCGNNPINRSDLSGAFWKEVGQALKKAWTGFKTWANDTFGAEATVDYQIKQEAEASPVPKAITVKHGTKYNQNQYKRGNSSKPVSVYAQGRSDNYMLSSVGMKTNIFNMTFDVSIGADDLGMSVSYNGNGAVYSISATADISQFKIGIECSTSRTVVWDSNTTVSNYTNVSITGWTIMAFLGLSKAPSQVINKPVKIPSREPIPV